MKQYGAHAEQLNAGQLNTEQYEAHNTMRVPSVIVTTRTI